MKKIEKKIWKREYSPSKKLFKEHYWQFARNQKI